MKQKITYLMAMLCLTALVMSAQPQPKQPQRACDVVKMNFVDKESKTQISRECASVLNNTYQYYSEDNIAQPQKASSPDSATVILRFNYDTEVQDMSVLMIYNNDWQFYDNNLRSYMHQGQHVMGGSFTVPKGTYDIYTVAVNQSYDEPGEYNHINELVDLTHDTTIVIDVVDCENHFVAELKDKNGEILNTPIIQYIDHDPWIEIVDEGTAFIIGGTRFLTLDGYGPVSRMYTNHWGSPESNDKGFKNMFINTLSDRYQCGVTYYIKGKDGEYYINKVVCKGTSTLPLTNDVNDYVYFEEDIKNTPEWSNALSEDSQGGVFYYEDGVFYGWTTDPVGGCMSFSYLNEDKNGAFTNPTYFKLPDNTFKVYVNAPKQEDDVENRIDMTFTLSIPNAKVASPPSYDYYNINTPEIISHADKSIEYLVTNSDTKRSYVNGWDKDYPAHPLFSYTREQKKGIFGNNCPLARMPYGGMNMKQLSSTEYLVCPFNDIYVGRYGETIENGNIYSTLVAKYNNEVIWDGNAKIDSLSRAWLIQENKTNGLFELTINNSNVDVDGINGKVTTTIHFDQTKDDWCAPALSMLQFRNGESSVTDRFETPEDGIIMFAGGDFDPKFIPYVNASGLEDIWDYKECLPMNVEVLYAPYGTEEWQPLEGVSYINGHDDIPGLGFFYAGPLTSVNTTSENGWFDLKFRLEDESGNWQEQTLSPAFRIDALVQSAVTEVRDNDAHEVARYSIDGKRVDDSHHGIVIVKMSDGTARKVLVP